MPFSNFALERILRYNFGGLVYTLPTAWTVRLYTATPTWATGAGGTEVTGNGYTAPTVANTTANWVWDAANIRVANDTTILFGTPSAGWGTIAAWAITDSSGNLWGGDIFATPPTITTSGPVVFAPGALRISRP